MKQKHPALGKAKTPNPKKIKNATGYHVVAVKPDGITPINEVVGCPRAGLMDNTQGAVVITDDNGEVKAGGEYGLAIGDENCIATGGKQGLAYVSSGKAIGGAQTVAINRGAGIAQSGDGGVSVATYDGHASVGCGVAVAYNSRGSFQATADASLGGVLVFGYTTDATSAMKFAVAVIDGVNYLPATEYQVNICGKIVPA